MMVYHLKMHFLTIQKGIDSLSSSGGVVLVYPGVYSLNQSLLIDQQENVNLISMDGAKYTVITRPDYDSQLQNDYRLLTVNKSPTTYVNGFTFRNGYSILNGQSGDILQGNGGGILLSDDTNPSGDTGAVVEDCIIKDCYAFQYGGGIHINDKKGLISRCIVDNCNVEITGYNAGGGISLRWEGYARNCLVTNCNAVYGAVLCYNGICQVHQCTVVNNGPNSSGIILFGGSSPGHQVYNCISYNNTPNDIVVVSGASDIQNTLSSNGLGTNPLSSDPLFKNSNEGDYTLSYNSPALGHGITSLSYPKDLKLYEIINNDIGCYQYYSQYY